MPAAAFVASWLQSPLYEATAKVVLNRQSLASTLAGTTDPTIFQEAERFVQTQAELAAVPEVAARAVRAVPQAGLTAEELLRQSDVSPEPNVDILVFEVQDERGGLATRLATAYARAYTQYRAQVQVDALEGARADVESQIERLRGQGATDAELQSLLDQQQQLLALEALQTGNAAVVDEAAAAEQVRPRPVRNVALGAVLGLGLGLLLALLADALDTRVRTSEELAEALGLPLLGRIPRQPRSVGRQERPAMLVDPTAPIAEAYRMLRTNVDFANLDVGARAIMLTSAVEEEGKSTTAANLALAYAVAGRRVVLLDFDLRRPSLHRFFDGPLRPGVADVVVGDVAVEEALVRVPLPDQATPAPGSNGRPGSLHLLPAGPMIPNPGEFLASPRLASLLAALRARVDVVLIDAPPLLRVGDAMAMSSTVDAFVVVARLRSLRRQVVADLRRLLEASPVPALGFAVTDASDMVGYGYGPERDARTVSPRSRRAARRRLAAEARPPAGS